MIKRSEELDRYLNMTVDKGGSDLHIQTGSRPAIRILGDVVFLDEEILTHQRTEALVKEVLDEAHFNTLFKTGSVDFAYEVKDLARFRANFLLQHYGYGMVLRVIPSRIPTLEELNLPSTLFDICEFDKGLAIVTGLTTGSLTKSTRSQGPQDLRRQIKVMRPHHQFAVHVPMHPFAQ